MALIQIDWNPPPKTLRQFGLIGLGGFGLLAALAYFQWLLFAYLPDSAAKPTAYAFIAVAMYSGFFAAVAPPALKPLYVLMTVITFPIGLVVSYLTMAVIFYGILTPVGLIFKLIGRDAMNRKFEPSATTYWVKRKPPANVKRYFRQF
ncbi:MAG: hypothetical protein MI923_01780 [Phycisphaerales bacterium]|nr:hypothetical protein [Phycisphaerales bacterium]